MILKIWKKCAGNRSISESNHLKESTGSSQTRILQSGVLIFTKVAWKFGFGSTAAASAGFTISGKRSQSYNKQRIEYFTNPILNANSSLVELFLLLFRLYSEIILPN